MDKALKEFFDAVLQLWRDILDWLGYIGQDVGAKIFQQIIDFLVKSGEYALALMPDMTTFCEGCFAPPSVTASSHLVDGIWTFARWILPITAMECLLGITVTAMVFNFTGGAFLRWLKVIR